MITPNNNIPTAILLMLISMISNAQTSMGGGSGPPAPQGAPPPIGLPIDDGLIILLAVAFIYGVYIVLKHSKKQTQA